MPAGREDRGRRLAIFRLALAEGCTMQQAAERHDRRTQLQAIDAARAAHGEAMRRLFAKGYGKR